MMQTYELTVINLMMLFGALQGLILALILVTTPRLRKRSNHFLALLLFTFAMTNIMGTLEDLSQHDPKLIVQYLPLFWFNLIPPCIYFFVKYLINPNHKISKVELLLFVPFLFEFGYRLFKFSSYLTGDYFNQEQIIQFYIISNVYETLAVVFTIIINVLAIVMLRKYEKELYNNYSEVQDKSLNWLRITIIGGLVISFFWFVTTTRDFSPKSFHVDYLSYVLWLGLSVLIYWIGYSMIIRQGLLDTPIFAISRNGNRSSSGNDLSSKTDAHYERIIKLMEDEKLYQNSNLNMSMLSELTGLSNGYLSQIINQKRGQNFFNFVNQYRIEEVKKNLNDPKLEHFSLLGLAMESGFKSKSTFNSVFKKLTGTTPSEYKKNLQRP